MKTTYQKIVPMLIAALATHGCATAPEPKYQVNASSIAAGADVALPDNTVEVEPEAKKAAKVQTLNAIGLPAGKIAKPNDMAALFSDTETVVFAAEKLPLKDFIHHLFSDLLGKSYVLASEISGLDDPVTLNVKDALSQRQAFRLAFDLLQKKGVAVTEKEGVFYLAAISDQAQSAIGVGADLADVPNVAGTITQIVPLKFGNSSIEGSIASFVPVRVSRDQHLNTLFVTGTYADVVRAMDVIKLMDTPANRGKYIRLLRLTYLTPADFSKQVQTLLESEAVDGIGVNSPSGKSLVFVTLDHLGAVAIFSSNSLYLERALYWAEQIDVPGEGVQKRYFIYHPSYARAADLGESIAALIGQPVMGNNSRDTQSGFNAGQSNGAAPAADASSSAGSAGNGAKSGPMSVQNDRLSMTVDERSNTIIFYTQGSEYQSLLPMIKRLDVMPKQVLLEATIAEVTLTDDFAMGVEFAFTSGKFASSTTNALGVGKITGLNLGYVNGSDSVLARLKQSNQQVNVLSNPSIVVRDGVTADMSAGTELPSVSSTTSDPLLSDKQITTITYRQTGLQFSVTPTINGQGLVVMQIKQDISNQAEGSAVAGAPAIFKRTLNTEVIAQSGQTVLLGGLISENNDTGDTEVPGLAKLPLFGHLFKSRSNKKVKTELVLLITPRVIDAASQWNYINGQVQQGFKHLQINN